MNLFQERLPLAERYRELLADQGVLRGLIGPREVDRLWDRHVLNSAVIGEVMRENARVVDVGSGAGLPGIPLSLARPDLDVTLVEPMARRVAWLEEVVTELGLAIRVVRGRADDADVLRAVAGADYATARAVAPLAKLCGWCLPLLRPGGELIAIKGASAQDEVVRDQAAIARVGGREIRIQTCGDAVLDVPTTVVLVRREPQPGRARPDWARKDR